MNLKKILISFVISLFSFSLVFAQDVNSVFLDLNSSYQYFESIKFLKDNNVINGYPDGTFRPNNTLKRAELAKIVVLSSKIPEVTARNCFPDLDPSQWYAQYVCAAKASGLVQGYVDGTFKPSRDISRAEAIKIMAEAEDFDLDQNVTDVFLDVQINDWFYNYANVSKTLGVLPFESNLNPGSFITRAEFSEMYARSLKLPNSTFNNTADTSNDDLESTPEVSTNENTEESSDVEVDNAVNVNVDDVNFSNVITSDSFDSFVFDVDIPQVFVENEMYRFEGELDSQFNFAFAVIVDEGENNNFIAKVDNGRFSVDVFFPKDGEFKLGFIAGNSGKTKVFPISVIDKLPPGTSAIAKPVVESSVNLGFRNNKPGVFLPDSESFKLIEVSQSGRSRDIITRQNIQFLPLNYSEFDAFSEGSFDVEVKYFASKVENGTLSVSQSLKLFDQEVDGVMHLFSEIDENLSNLVLPNNFTPGDNLSVSFDSDLDLSLTVYFIQPDGLVETNRQALQKNANSYSYDFTLNDAGTYIIEINNSAGLAVINHPIYMSPTFPLVAEYFDDFETEQDGIFNESDQVSYTLALVNDERRKYGFDPVILKNDLSSLARLHANDMIDRNYFAHVSLDGLTPNDRRLREGITTPVGENLAKDLSTLRAHRSLMRSAAHRANILNPSWNTVGISVLLDESYYYVVQQFSFDFDNLSTDLETELTKLNTSLLVDTDLNDIAENWLQIMMDSGQFGTTINGQSIFDGITAEMGFARLFSLISKASDLDSIIAQLSENQNLLDIQNDKFAFDLDVDRDGLINFVLVFGE
jgi:uncharacterized protein YkwD